MNYRLDPLGIVDGFTAEVGASGVFCPTHLTLPVEVSFYSVSDDNAPSPYMASIFSCLLLLKSTILMTNTFKLKKVLLWCYFGAMLENIKHFLRGD